MTCQMSLIVAVDFGNSSVRMIALPSARISGAPSPVKTLTWAPIQLACWLPLAKLQVPLRRNPPGTVSALAGPGGPQPTMPSRGPKIVFAHLGGEKGGAHRAAAALTDAPGGAGVVAGDLFDDLSVVRRPQFGAAERARLQQPIEPGVDQRVDEARWQLAVALDLVGRAVDRRADGPRAVERIAEITPAEVHTHRARSRHLSPKRQL